MTTPLEQSLALYNEAQSLQDGTLAGAKAAVADLYEKWRRRNSQGIVVP